MKQRSLGTSPGEWCGCSLWAQLNCYPLPCSPGQAGVGSNQDSTAAGLMLALLEASFLPALALPTSTLCSISEHEDRQVGQTLFSFMLVAATAGRQAVNNPTLWHGTAQHSTAHHWGRHPPEHLSCLFLAGRGLHLASLAFRPLLGPRTFAAGAEGDARRIL